MKMKLMLLAMGLCLAGVANAVDVADVYDAVEHHTVDNDGVNIHYVTLGEGDPVLFVHGFPDFWYSWKHQMAGLADDYKCVAMDMRAYNKSDKPEGVENYSIDLLLSDIGAVIEDLGVDNLILVGHDWGGALAWQYAIQNPDDVNKLIICNLTHPRGYDTVRRNATPEQKANTAYIERFQDPDAAKMFTPQMLAGIAAGPEPADVKEKFVAAFENSYVDGMLNYYRALWPLLQSGELGSQETPNLRMPVLQFHGLKDTAVDKDGLRDTWNWIDADYTLVTVPDAGHWVQREAADVVTSTMKWWLAARE